MRFFSLNKMEFFLVNTHTHTHTHDMEDWGGEVKKLEHERFFFFLEYNEIFLQYTHMPHIKESLIIKILPSPHQKKPYIFLLTLP